jgi:acyl-CoA synthetase (NDP forming)
MTTDLAALLNPRSIALIGATPDHSKIRGALLERLQANNFAGAIYPVNPSHTEINGLRCYPSMAAIGAPIDLAAVALPAKLVAGCLEECAAAGVRFAVVISSGFAEEGGEGAAMQARIAEIAQRTGLRVSGPNGEGFFNALDGVAVTFSPTVAARSGPPLPVLAGRAIGVVAQSGGMGFAFYNRGRALALPFSHVVSTGNEADLTAADFFDYLVDDPRTGVILLFLEAVRDPATFMAAARRAQAAGKPVIAIKMGGSEAGVRATASHTGSMAGWHTGYRTAFRQFGMIEASDPDEAVAIAGALATAPRAAGRRVAVVTLSGGAGAWAADALAAAGLELPEQGAGLQARIAALLPSYGTARNPVDVTAQAVRTGGLQQAIAMICASGEVDQVFAVLSLASETRATLTVAELREMLEQPGLTRRIPILCFSYALPSRLALETFAEAGAVVFAGLREAAAAAAALVAPTEAVTVPAALRAPPNLPPGSGTLSEAEAREVLAAWGIATPPAVLATDEASLRAAGAALGYPLALKAQSRDLPHKTEFGGVALGLEDEAALVAAWHAMHVRLASARPGLALQGMLVTPMAASGIEIIIGGLFDSVFGAMISVGAGGTGTELYQDIGWRLAPVDAMGAEQMLRELRCFPLLEGFRGAEPTDVAALARLVADVSGLLACAAGRISEVEVNPVRVRADGVAVLDVLLALT